MFSFLNGTVLIAAVAALIPLVIHLLSRRRVKIIEFSSLRHLKAMQKRQVRRLKIRQLLLLLLRMLIILAVVLAFARPTTKSELIGSHASVSAVILFDNSASMDRYVADGNLLELAKKRTKELLGTFGQADEVAVLPLAGHDPDEPSVGFNSAAVAEKTIDQITTGYDIADFQTALEATSELLTKSGNLNREVYIITDRQKLSLPEEPLSDTLEANVYVVGIPEEDPENCGVTGVDFGGQLIQPGYNFDLVATVKNYGLEDKTNVLASLFMNDKRLSQTNFDINAGDEVEVRFTTAVTRTGFHSGYVEIADDKLLQDNRYYFSFRIPERFNLLIVGGDNSSRFLSLALEPDQSLSRFWSVKEASADDLAGVNFDDYDVIFLAGGPELGKTHLNRLKSFVNRGGALFVSYGNQKNVDYFNQNLAGMCGVTYEAGLPDEFSRMGYYTLQSVETNHPVFSVFDFKDSKPPEIKFYALPQVTVDNNARVVMRFSGDRPAMVEKKYGGGKVLTFIGPISPQFTDLTGHAFFVPMISRIAEYLASDLSTLDLHLQTGAVITRTLTTDGPVTSPVVLFTPDGNQIILPPEEDQGAMMVRVNETEVPGIYRIMYQGKEIDRFAVNMNPAEGDLRAAGLDEFMQALGIKEYRLAPEDRALAGVISEFRFGRELWQLFIWAAVIFIILEILLARTAPVEE